MPRRHPPEALSPRALARLRASPRSYVPTELDLAAAPPGWGGGASEEADVGSSEEWAAERFDGVGAHLGGRSPGEHLDGGGAGQPLAGGWAGARHGRVPHPRVWVRLPAAFVGARWQPGRAALVGVVVVVALAVAVFGLRVAWARSADSGTVIAPGGGS